METEKNAKMGKKERSDWRIQVQGPQNYPQVIMIKFEDGKCQKGKYYFTWKLQRVILANAVLNNEYDQ